MSEADAPEPTPRPVAQGLARWGPAAAALLLVALTGALQAVAPRGGTLNRGYVTPILAIELAQTAEDVAFLAGDGEAAERRAALDLSSYVDMLFPLAYAGLIALLLLPAARRGEPVARAGIAFAAVTYPFDVAENLTLLALTDALGAGADPGGALGWLFYATWVKWLALGGALLCLAAVAWRGSKVAALFLALPAPIAVATLVAGAPGALGEAMGLTVVLAYLAAVVLAVARAWRPGAPMARL